jgi:hypothetical protein
LNCFPMGSYPEISDVFASLSVKNNTESRYQKGPSTKMNWPKLNFVKIESIGIISV